MKTQLNCPRCQTKLTRQLFRPVIVDRCESCDSIWFDSGELYAYVRKRSNVPECVPTEQVFSTLGPYGKGDCPKCETSTLGSGTYLGVDYLKCSSCVGMSVSMEALAGLPHRLSGWEERRPWKAPPDGPDLEWAPISILWQVFELIIMW